MEVTKNDYLSWLTHPVTKEVWAILSERRYKYAEALADGGCLDDPVGHAVAVGRCLEINDLLSMTYEDMEHKEE